MKEGKFKHVKQQELIALQKRIQTGREEQKKQRHQDLERYVPIAVVFLLSLPTRSLIPNPSNCCIFRLLQRYQNVKAELEAQQNLERVRMEKLVQSGALTASRR